jgi:hypothetical protein
VFCLFEWPLDSDITIHVFSSSFCRSRYLFPLRYVCRCLQLNYRRLLAPIYKLVVYLWSQIVTSLHRYSFVVAFLIAIRIPTCIGCNNSIILLRLANQKLLTTPAVLNAVSPATRNQLNRGVLINLDVSDNDVTINSATILVPCCQTRYMCFDSDKSAILKHGVNSNVLISPNDI